MEWKQLADAWNDEFESMIPVISADDLHALALALVGDPSPRGQTPVSADAIEAIARGEPSPHDWRQYARVYRAGDEVAAARWALEHVATRTWVGYGQ